MPDPIDELTDEQLDALPEGLRGEVRKNRQYRAEAEAAKLEAEQAKRDAAMARANLPDTPIIAKLAEGYTGENDPEAIRSYFEGLGVDLAAPGGNAGGTASDAELEEQRRLAAVGSQGGVGGDVRFEDAIASASSADAVMDLIAAAPEGATTYVEGRARRIGVPVIE